MGDLIKSALLETKAAAFVRTIKKSTAELHANLESQELLSAIMTPGVTNTQYCLYLVLMKKIEEAYERDIVAPLADHFPGIEQRKASKLIADDLSNIGSILPKSFTLKDFDIPAEKISKPFAMGFMYVMEGSKLGGKVIYKHIQRTLGYSAKSGAKFIADDGVDTFGLWKEFLLKFSNYATEAGCEEEAIQGAEYAFSSIRDFFELNTLAYGI